MIGVFGGKPLGTTPFGFRGYSFRLDGTADSSSTATGGMDYLFPLTGDATSQSASSGSVDLVFELSGNAFSESTANASRIINFVPPGDYEIRSLTAQRAIYSMTPKHELTAFR